VVVVDRGRGDGSVFLLRHLVSWSCRRRNLPVDLV
jgi:hypothetical protein